MIGFILFGLEIASSLITTCKYNKIIVVGVDTMSSILDYKDRNTCILFGDGAGAVLLEPSLKYGMLDCELGVDGAGRGREDGVDGAHSRDGQVEPLVAAAVH